MGNQLVSALYSLPAVIVGLTLHEFAHAYVSYKCGDSTAKDDGRITLNPLHHIDIMGFVFLMFAGFGWAKPVQFNPEKLKNPRRDRILIALAGPLTNLALGIIFSLVFTVLNSFFPSKEAGYTLFIAYNVLLSFVFINFGLFFFNIIPLPPLDGSHVLFQSLNISEKLQEKIFSWGTALLFVILIVERRFDIDILYIGKAVQFIAGIFLPDIS